MDDKHHHIQSEDDTGAQFAAGGTFNGCVANNKKAFMEAEQAAIFCKLHLQHLTNVSPHQHSVTAAGHDLNQLL